jgi:hypothetical protein
MVSCKTVIANLSNYLDGDPAAEMREKIEKLLRGCRRALIPTRFNERLHGFLDPVVSNPEAH